LDRLERLADLVLNAQLGPVYLRVGEPVPEGLELERVVYIERVFIDPPEQPAEQLPETTETSPAIERPSPPSFRRPLPDYPLGIVFLPEPPQLTTVSLAARCPQPPFQEGQPSRAGE